MSREQKRFVPYPYTGFEVYNPNGRFLKLKIRLLTISVSHKPTVMKDVNRKRPTSSTRTTDLEILLRTRSKKDFKRSERQLAHTTGYRSFI